MDNKILKLVALASIGLFVFAIGLASFSPDDGRPSPLSFFLSALGDPLINTDEEILIGYREFDGNIHSNRLSFHGAAITLLNANDPSTFKSYNFAFDRDGFAEMPDTNTTQAFYDRYDADFPTTSGVDIESCVQPRPDTIATEDGTSLIFPTLCRIDSSTSDGPSGMIGVVFPADNEQPLADGDATCRAEIAHWRTLSGFADMPIVLCAVVDRPNDVGAHSGRFWMDVILYQHLGNDLYNMRAESRNFQRIN
jgi:hypothetical protein